MNWVSFCHGDFKKSALGVDPLFDFEVLLCYVLNQLKYSWCGCRPVQQTEHSVHMKCNNEL